MKSYDSNWVKKKLSELQELIVSQSKTVKMSWKSEIHLKMIFKIFRMHEWLIWTLYTYIFPMAEAQKQEKYITGLQANEFLGQETTCWLFSLIKVCHILSVS